MKTHLKKILSYSFIFLTLLPLLHAEVHSKTVPDTIKSSEVRTWLNDFHKNPALQINKKFKENKNKNLKPIFSPSEIKSKNYVLMKDVLRKKIIERSQLSTQEHNHFYSTLSASLSNDRVEDLVDLGEKAKSNLYDLDLVRSGETTDQPWTDGYWPIYKGLIGARYSDSRFPSDWSLGSKKVFSDLQPTRLSERSPFNAADFLSPAEKYDLLIGQSECAPSEHNLQDNNLSCFGLTKKNWRVGKSFYELTGGIESWMGICHGWAAASFMEKPPLQSVLTFSPTGVPIRFFPSDIKALSSYLWANSKFSSKFIGGRCNTKKPEVELKTGRVIDQNCFDNNPGTFHKALINQIGISKRPFIFDSTYDYEVWNFPVTKFSYSYFNPQSLKVISNVEDGITSLSLFKKDKFEDFRSSETKFIIGVIMQVTYVIESEPNHENVKPIRHQSIQSTNYIYDLELDAARNIIGGEWYQNTHPDFMWVPEKETIAQSSFENEAVGEWNPSQLLPESWKNAAQNAIFENESGLPLQKIIRSLISQSRP